MFLRRASGPVVAFALTIFVVIGVQISVRTVRSRDPWKTPQRISSLTFGAARAAQCGDPGVVRVDHFASSYIANNSPGSWMCANGEEVFGQGTMVTFCDGGVEILQPTSGDCYLGEDACTIGKVTNDWGGDPCNTTQLGEYCCHQGPPFVAPSMDCEVLCPPKPPCCKGSDCSDCAINPLSLPASELAYTLPVFNADGFPPFEVYWRGRTLARLSNLGNPLGPRASHSLSFFLWKGVDELGTHHAHVAVEHGGVEAFTWDGSAWTPDDGRKSTLLAGAPGSCADPAVLTTPNAIYRFNDFCDGSTATEGMIFRLERPDGDYLDFVATPHGQIGTVTNRKGAILTFDYQGTEQPFSETWGRLYSVTAPGGDVFRIRFVAGLLSRIEGPSGPIWDLETEPKNGALLSVRDGAGGLENAWTYDPLSGGTILASESGPGETVGNNQIDISTSGNSAYLTFTPAGATTPVTNEYSITQVTGALAHVTGRTLAGECPNCGGSNQTRVFWDNTNLPRAVENGNGFITVYEDLTNQGNFSAAYDELGNPKVINEGCTGTLSAPSCSRRLSFTYQPGSAVVATSTRPSAAGPGVIATSSRTFAGSSTRVLLDSKTGRTAVQLDGALDDEKTRVVQRTYGSGAAGIEVSRIDGPYDGTLGVNDPRTDYSYYGTSPTDSCSGAPAPNNRHQVNQVTRWIDATRSLVTTYCNFDAAGRARKIKDHNNVVTDLLYNWRGQVTSQIRSLGSTSFETLYDYDPVGNLVRIRLPRITSNGRTGVKYTYDDADRLVKVETGYFTGLVTPVMTDPLLSVQYTRDAWGNTTKTEWRNDQGVLHLSEGAKFDAFNRLVCVARPYSSDCSGQKTEFEYDAEGNLLRSRDAQGDDIRFGGPSLSPTSPPEVPDWTYDNFGKVTRVQQEICLHPATDANGSCVGATLTNVDYLYDAALQLSSITVNDSVRGGQISTSYVTDDFGQVVKVGSPDGGSSFFTYDGAGRLYEISNALATYRLAYDRLGRLLSKLNVSTGVTELIYCYDGLNLGCGFTNNPQVATAGRLTAVKDAANKVQYSYDSFGRLAYENRVFPGATTPSVTYYSHNENGRRTGFTTPLGPPDAGGLTISYVLDDADRITKVNWSGPSMGGTIVRDIEWDASGPLRKWKRGISSGYFFEIIRDGASGRIIETKLNSSASVKLIWDSYAYASDGNVSKIPATVATPNILHDSQSRITQDRTASSVQSFTYDDAGNRVTHTGSSNYTYAAAANNRLVTAEGKTFGYDAAGNVSARVPGIGGIGYSGEGRVTSVTTGSGTTTYTRDYRGLRVQKAGAGGSGSYFFDPEGQLIHWQGPVTTLGCTIINPPNPNIRSTKKKISNETYVHLDGRPTAAIKSYVETACGESTYTTFVLQGIDYYYTEKMGVPRGVLSDASGAISGSAVLDAFGNPLSTSGTYAVPFRLPGQYALGVAEGGPSGSVGGLHENWNRLYDSQTGRYLQPDPFGQLADISLYRYAYNQPLLYVDPDGRGVLRLLCLSAFTGAGAWAGSTVGAPLGAGIGAGLAGGGGAVTTGGPGVVLGVPGAGVGMAAGAGIGGVGGAGLGAAAGQALCPDDDVCKKTPCTIKCFDKRTGALVEYYDNPSEDPAACATRFRAIQDSWDLISPGNVQCYLGRGTH